MKDRILFQLDLIRIRFNKLPVTDASAMAMGRRAAIFRKLKKAKNPWLNQDNYIQYGGLGEMWIIPFHHDGGNPVWPPIYRKQPGEITGLPKAWQQGYNLECWRIMNEGYKGPGTLHNLRQPLD